MRRIDAQKLQQWKERFLRFQSSELTVERFCAREQVSPNTFYYWMKRVGWRSAKLRSVPRAPDRFGESVRHATFAALAPNSAMVQFRLHGAEISVPANCFEVIRFLTRCVQHATTDRRDAFQEIHVRNSIAAE